MSPNPSDTACFFCERRNAHPAHPVALDLYRNPPPDVMPPPSSHEVVDVPRCRQCAFVHGHMMIVLFLGITVGITFGLFALVPPDARTLLVFLTFVGLGSVLAWFPCVLLDRALGLHARSVKHLWQASEYPVVKYYLMQGWSETPVAARTSRTPSPHRTTSRGKHRRPPRRHREEEDARYAAALELEGEITPERIKAQYRKRVAEYHPDRVEHLGPKLKAVAEQEMKDINKAYAYFKKKYGL